jgi:hypothetical protein
MTQATFPATVLPDEDQCKRHMTPTPLEKMLAAFPDAYQHRNGWWTNDDNPRFSFLELPDGDIRVKPWTGRTIDDILSMGQIPLSRANLFAKPGQWSAIQHHDKLDLLTFAEYMCIDWEWFFNEGYSDGYQYTYSNGESTVYVVKLGGYCAPDGTENPKAQVRLSLHKEPRFLFNQNTPGEVIPCGLHYLPRAREAGYLVLGEGNSDWATMTFHGIPFVGIPGTEHAQKLDVALLKDIPTVYIIEEPDQAKKLQRTGQGFYKNVRQHLRENGYQGEIFSLRFLQATGYKDPSDLHKAMYASCKEQAEGPFRQEVHKRFLEAIEQAIEHALPEGNTSAPAKIPEITFEEFSRQVWAVSTEFLSPIQKVIVCYLFLYMREIEPDELGWRIDAEKMAKDVGLRGPKGQKQFLEHLSYLHQKLGILHKERRAIKEYLNGEDKPEQIRYKGTVLYIDPQVSYYTPGGYCVVTEDQHRPGGPRIATEVCVQCGSRHLKHYASQCVDCGHMMVDPEYPKMGCSDKESITVPQNGVLENPTCVQCGSEDLDIDEVQTCRNCNRIHIISKTAEQDQAAEDEQPVESSAVVLPLAEEVEPTGSQLNGHTKVMAELANLFESRERVFWRLQLCGYMVGHISTAECLKRLTHLLTSGDTRLVYEAEQAIEAWLKAVQS